MKILITGGAGFIGSHIAGYFLQMPEYEVCCLDNFDPYYDPAIKFRNIGDFLHNPRFELVKGDLRDPAILRAILPGVDYIFHEAAQPGIPVSVRDPLKSHEMNTTGTLNLLDAARDFPVRKIIFGSSSSVYGTVRYLPFDEEHPANPVSPYGITKLMGEHYCRVFEELYGLRSVSLRYFTVYGPRMRPDLAIHTFMERALRNEPVIIFGDGSKKRDFTYIEDVVSANVLAMDRGSGVYNIGGGQVVTIRELAERILGLARSRSVIEYRDDVQGDAQSTAADTRKAERELGWKPTISLDAGLARYQQWLEQEILRSGMA